MDEKELRIGNYIDRTDYICVVKSLGENCIMTEPLNYENERFVIQDLKPIPLTEDWLLKFGFEKVGHSFFLNGLEIFEDDGNYFYGLRDEGMMDLHLEFVHTTQNLYSILKVEELTIK